MILLFLFWIYYFFLFSVIGFVITELFNKILGTKHKPQSLSFIFFIGLAGLLTTLEALSLAIAINWHIHLFFFVSASIYSYIRFNKLRAFFKQKIRYLISNKLYVFSLLFFFVFIIFHGSDGPVYNLDPARYHFQIINWAINFPAIPGLANLHDRFGAMGTWHLIHAFSEISFAKELTYHIFNSLILFILFARLLNNLFNYLKLRLLSYLICFELTVLIVLLYYLNFIQYWFLSCPSPDLPNIITCIICFVYFLANQKEIKDKNHFHIAVLSLLCFSGFSIKLSALFLCFLLVKPTLDIVVNYKKSKKALVLIAFLFGLNYGSHLIKNTIVSGWPLYPVTMINFGGFDWQYPKEKADGWSACISHDAFAPEKGTETESYLGYEKKTKKEMFLIWFNREFSGRGYIFYIFVLSIISICFVLMYKQKGYSIINENITVTIVAFICFGLWISNAPDIRFGLGYLAILFGVLTAPILYGFKQKYFKVIILLIVVALSLQSFLRSTPISISEQKLNYPIALFNHIFNSNELLNLRGIPKAKYKKHFVSPDLIINYSVRDTSYGSFGRNEPFYLGYYDLNKIETDSITKAKMANSNNSNLLDWSFPLPASHTVYDELELRTGDLRDGFRFNRAKSKKNK